MAKKKVKKRKIHSKKKTRAKGLAKKPGGMSRTGTY